MDIIKFFLFFIVTQYGLLSLFSFTTYHAHFWKMLPLLIGYAALAGNLFFLLEIDSFFLWLVFLYSASLLLIGRNSAKQAEALLQTVGDNIEALRLVAISSLKTTNHYTLSSLVYVVGFSSFYLWRLNQALP